MLKRIVGTMEWAVRAFDHGCNPARCARVVIGVRLLGLVTTAVLLSGSTAARAQVYWSNTSSGDWSIASNWSGNLAPTGSDYAYIVNGGTADITQLGASCGTLSLGSGACSGNVQMTGGSMAAPYNVYIGDSGPGSFSQSGGTINAYGYAGNFYIGNQQAATGVYNLSGNGQLSVRYAYVGYSGSGTFNQSGGNSGIQQTYLGYNPGSSGVYNLSGGQMYGDIAIGNSGSASFVQTGGTNGCEGVGMAGAAGSFATYNLSGTASAIQAYTEILGGSGTAVFTQSGGVNNTLLWGGWSLQLAEVTGGSSAYYLSGGQVLAFSEIVGQAGNAIFTQTGGSNTIYGLGPGYGTDSGLILGDSPSASSTYNLNGGLLSGPFSSAIEFEHVGFCGPAVFTQTGGTNECGYLYFADYASGSGTYNLNGGLLTLYAVRPGPGSAAFNFSGGTLLAGSGFSTGLPMTLGTSGGGATFDTAGLTVTLSGALSGPGSLTKVDSGTLILSASNAYTGDTLVNEGMLTIDYPCLAAGSNAWIDNSGLGGTLDLNYSGADNINALYINGVEQAAGIWGGPGSGAPNTSSYLAGSGLLDVAVPEPNTLTLLATGALGLIGYGLRRRRIARTANPAVFGQQDAPPILAFPSRSSPSHAARRAA